MLTPQTKALAWSITECVGRGMTLAELSKVYHKGTARLSVIGRLHPAYAEAQRSGVRARREGRAR